MADEQPLGRRVAYWRNRRKMSQQVFADRLGKSKSWVDKVERGVRRLDRFSIIAEIAEVLHIDVHVLMSQDATSRPQGGNGTDKTSVEAIRSALEHYDRFSSFGEHSASAPALAELSKSVSHAWLTYQHSAYEALARLLPQLVGDAQAACEHYGGDEGRQAAQLLSQVYQIASCSLRKLGQNDLAWLAAERAVTASQQAQDDLLFASSIAQVAAALAAMGRLRPALELNISVANQMAQGDGAQAKPERLSVYGSLILQSALVAAKLGDSATVHDLITAAEDPAKRLGRDESYNATTFGPTALVLHRVVAAVELGDMARAVSTHNTVTAQGFAAMTPESRANYLLSLARAHSQLGDVTSAIESLTEAAMLAPTEVRHHPATGRLLADIAGRSDESATHALIALTGVLNHSSVTMART